MGWLVYYMQIKIQTYNNSKYASIGVGVNSINVPLGGSGKVVQFGVESTVDDTPVSIQKIDIYLKTGKTA